MTGRQGWNLKGQNSDRLNASGDAHYAWKGDDATPASKRQRARYLFALGTCDRCGKPGVDRHHIDGDTGNNAPENIMVVCRHCHMEIDGRLQQAVESLARSRNSRQREITRCKICGRTYCPLRLGRCASCAAYFRRWGKERPPEWWGRTKSAETRERIRAAHIKRHAAADGATNN